eukprot:TRINITY_DN4410_c0_g1::TRINITY_DN4410_c0_g1_i1::g.7275::m.7275 TRINITY_DN4410_c0_g1::TRINITY_DN4410_c0_g1_i1::g.7275  ORF type:complete len:187 (-),score=6.00,Orai-1/PF07856.7/1.4e-19,Jiraiya/PF15038.1/4.3e+02,Jiraiya/PF15038.1/0.027,7TM_GPCR_Srh/PF10318.4/0.099,7TM_GPCR_Srh/PF10318.4/4.6 TRINITY_DN4410_c0_g1_i1:46-606(-)
MFGLALSGGLAAADTIMTAESRQLARQNRFVDEKASMLGTLSQLSAIIAGFCMEILVQSTLPEHAPNGLLMAFGYTSSFCICMLMTSVVLMALQLIYVLNYRHTHNGEPFDEKVWYTRCENDWKWAYTTFKLGMVGFLASLALLSWLKFQSSVATSVGITVISTVSIGYWMFYIARRADVMTETTV